MSKIGYGKPPQKSQFQKGKSGNPNGRPRGRPKSPSRHQVSFLDDLDEVLNERIPVQEGDRKRKMTKRAILARTLVRDAMKGVSAAFKLLSQLMERGGHLEATPNPNPAHTGVLVVPATLERDEWQRLALAAHERMRREKNPDDR